MKLCLSQPQKLLELKTSFFCLFLFVSVFAVDIRNKELISNIDSYFSYLNVPVTFSIKIAEIPAGKLQFPSRYDQGYNELEVLGQNLLPIKKIPFYLDVKALVPVVKEIIEKGKTILEKDITSDWKQILDSNQQIIFDSKDIIGKENIFYKKKGETFYKYDIKEVDIIKKQDECTINAKSGSVRITMPGVSLKNGSLGSTIKVLNKQTGKILDARIIDSKNVEVVIN